MLIEIEENLVKKLKERAEGVLGREVKDEEMKLLLMSECDYWLSGDCEQFDEGFEDSIHNIIG